MSYKSSITVMLHHSACPWPLNVTVQIKQSEYVLVAEEIDLRHRISQMHLEFELHNLTDSISLQIKTSNQEINQCPIHIDRIVLDDLADIPSHAHQGKIADTEGFGNCLYSPGMLEYCFSLPLMGNASIATQPTCGMHYKDLK